VPRYGKDVIFSVNKGQILCDVIDGCSITVKFDDKKAIRVHAVEPNDHSSDSLFLMGYDKLYKEMKASKKMWVEITFFQNGTRGFEYNIDGLKFD
jgi:hypothetical protein